jgi:hypothetical protein
MLGSAIAHGATARMVNAIPTANANLAGFGAMYPLLARRIDVTGL